MRHWGFRLCYSAVVSVVAALPLASGAWGQVSSPTSESASGPGLDEIVVTATRRDESLGRVPVSVVAFSQEQMDVQGVKNIDDIATLTPGLTFTHVTGTDGGSGSKTDISIRGIQSSVGAGTTGIYIDDTPIQTRQLATSSTNSYPQIFDLGQVEVLRGPQGTLFGAGAEGGAVRFITQPVSLNKYSGYAKAEVSVTQSGAPSYEVGLAGGGPIVDGELGFRAGAWFRRDGGWIDRVDAETGQTVDTNSNSQDSAVLQLAFTWAPTSNLKITPSVLYQNTKLADSSLYWENLSNPSDSDFRNGRVLAQPWNDRFVLPALAIDYDLGFASLLSNSSFYNREATGTKDYTNWLRSQLGLDPLPTLPGENAPGQLRDTQNNITQELRLRSHAGSPLQWVVGLFYSHAKQLAYENYMDAYLDQTLMNATAGAPFCPPAGCDTEQFFGQPLLNGTSYFIGTEDTLDTQYAAYGQVDYNITEQLKLTAGVRYADMEYVNTTVTDGPLAGGLNTSGGKQVEHPVTPKFGASYQIDANNMIYASAAKGFRPGGSNIIVSSSCGADLAELGLTQVPPSYNSDSVWSYEIGGKSNLADGRLQINSSLFYIDWKNIQQLINLPGCGGGFDANVGAAVSKGFDLQTQFRPISSLVLGLSAGYTDAAYTQTVDGGAGSIVAEKGQAIEGVSKWSGTASGQYDFRLIDYKAYFRADFQFIGIGNAQNPQVFGYDPALYATPQETKMLSLRLGAIIGKWSVSIFADNVTDNEPVLSRGHDTTDSPLFTNYTYRPRTIGLTAISRF